MQFLAILGAIASLAIASFASPVEKRADGGVLLCTGPNKTGSCQYQIYKLDACIALGPPFLYNIQTFAPDSNDFICYPRTISCGQSCRDPNNCALASIDFNYEHKYNLGSLGWTKPALSFDCRYKHPKADDKKNNPQSTSGGSSTAANSRPVTAPTSTIVNNPMGVSSNKRPPQSGRASTSVIASKPTHASTNKGSSSVTKSKQVPSKTVTSRTAPETTAGPPVVTITTTLPPKVVTVTEVTFV